MLLGTLFTVSILISLGICISTQAFYDLSWIWILPVSAVGTLLVLSGICFLVIYISAQLVDTSKPQEKESKYYRFLINLVAEAAIPILSVKMQVEGLEKTPKNGRFLLVCNHLSLMDPVLLLHYFRKSGIAFISKQENQSMFLVGNYMHMIQCQLMNRENDREALKTILKCIELIKEDRASVAVFPEGYIKPDHKLHHFRHGVFKIAQKAKVPIVVCTLRGSQDVFRNGLHLKPTQVALHLVDVVQPEQYQELSTVDLSNLVYNLMASDLGEENISSEE